MSPILEDAKSVVVGMLSVGIFTFLVTRQPPEWAKYLIIGIPLGIATIVILLGIGRMVENVFLEISRKIKNRNK